MSKNIKIILGLGGIIAFLIYVYGFWSNFAKRNLKLAVFFVICLGIIVFLNYIFRKISYKYITISAICLVVLFFVYILFNDSDFAGAGFFYQLPLVTVGWIILNLLITYIIKKFFSNKKIEDKK